MNTTTANIRSLQTSTKGDTMSVGGIAEMPRSSTADAYVDKTESISSTFTGMNGSKPVGLTKKEATF